MFFVKLIIYLISRVFLAWNFLNFLRTNYAAELPSVPDRILPPINYFSLFIIASSKTKMKNESTQQQQIKTLASASATPPSSDHFESVVQKVFGGKLQTTYECLNCKSVSLNTECFTNLLLAIPEPKSTKNNSETATIGKKHAFKK